MELAPKQGGERGLLLTAPNSQALLAKLEQAELLEQVGERANSR